MRHLMERCRGVQLASWAFVGLVLLGAPATATASTTRVVVLDGGGDHVALKPFALGDSALSVEMWVLVPDPTVSDAPIFDFGGAYSSSPTICLRFGHPSEGAGGRMVLEVDNTATGGTKGSLQTTDNFPPVRVR